MFQWGLLDSTIKLYVFQRDLADSEYDLEVRNAIFPKFVTRTCNLSSPCSPGSCRDVGKLPQLQFTSIGCCAGSLLDCLFIRLIIKDKYSK